MSKQDLTQINLKKIGGELTHMNVDDLSTAEGRIVEILILAGILRIDKHNETQFVN